MENNPYHSINKLLTDILEYCIKLLSSGDRRCPNPAEFAPNTPSSFLCPKGINDGIPSCGPGVSQACWKGYFQRVIRDAVPTDIKTEDPQLPRIALKHILAEPTFSRLISCILPLVRTALALDPKEWTPNQTQRTSPPE